MDGVLQEKKHNILIVEDSSSDRKLIRRIVETIGNRVNIIEKDSGRDFLKTVVEQEVKVVLLDLMLQEEDGMTLLECLKRDKSTCDIPVIILSGLTDDVSISRALSLRAYDYFEKPLTDRDIRYMLAIKVRNALDYKLKLEHVQFLTDYDRLTGALTRDAFEARLAHYRYISDLQSGLIMVDVNGLKIINDVYGHGLGDKILREVCSHLGDCFGEKAVIARWGSDEFAIWLKDRERHHIMDIITYCNDSLERKKCCEYSLSFGWSFEKSNGLDLSQMIKLAENNLLSNKIMERSSTRRRLIDSIVQTLHQKNPREERHSQRVSVISAEIAQELGLSEYEIRKVELAALMHDVGKIVIDEQILNKVGRLNEKEWMQIRRHPEIGYRILATSSDTAEIAGAALAHHERWDGNGYPKGLAREEIPFVARIIAVADTFDAMTGRRPYREPMSRRQAIDEIKRCSGTQFDPIIVEAFLRREDTVQNIFGKELEYVV